MTTTDESRETILVTGGAGYVGAHTCFALSQAGYRVEVVDTLTNGHRAFAKFGPLHEIDIRDEAAMTALIRAVRPAAVLHFAALIEVGESVKDPAAFYDVNVRGALALLAAMRANDVDKIVFSSTCATYGPPQRLPLDETHPQAPINPYGWTKLMVERAILDMGAAYGLRAALLRYFNAAGAAPDLGLGERHSPETHAIPLALFAQLGRRQGFSVFGDDYDTRDGTCVRDYIHVLDLADAHVRALRRLLDGGDTQAFNLGTGDGVTVKELLAAIERVTGRPLDAAVAPRRPGDAPALVADASKAATMLGWRPTRTLDTILADAWAWHSQMEARVFN
ncbi:MAG: UDP-glucose 4-epimerase GalE [Alphaproteobacteria bacterium]|nr:UDP-glucose 4-epimerase GalE [Alphaproteobacteria bacterium]